MIDLRQALEAARNPDLPTLVANTGLWLKDADEQLHVGRETELTLDYAELEGRTTLRELTIKSYAKAAKDVSAIRFSITRQSDGQYKCIFRRQAATQLRVELDHFLPYLLIDRSSVGPRDRQRSWHNAFLVLFAQPLEDLKVLLSGFAYLGSMRMPPPTLYKPVTVPPEEIGASGEYAAQMLHARRSDHVHYLPPLRVNANAVEIPDTVRSRNLVDAVNDVLGSLGVETSLRIDDVKDIGFRLLFGQASLQHVGRGLSYLLPVIELGLIADPLRFEPKLEDVPLAEYQKACPYYTHVAFEEGEAHLHPKVQTRLAHWLVALAMARRQLLVETHSNHLVRRLRGLAARAKAGSELERWLIDNVTIIRVEQRDGQSIVNQAALTSQGSLEDWPADFMDEATDEERAIYDASLDKPATPPVPSPNLGEIEHDVDEEPNDGP